MRRIGGSQLNYLGWKGGGGCQIIIHIASLWTTVVDNVYG